MNEEKFKKHIAREEREQSYRDFCQDHGLDPEDETNREEWEENEKERDGHSWEQMDPEDEAGWIDNMHKD